MPRYLLMAMNNPLPGEENAAAFAKWYDEIHIPDLLATPGVKYAKRYKIVSTKTPRPWTNVAVYEIETDDLPGVFEHLQTKTRPFDPSFDRSQSESITAIELED